MSKKSENAVEKNVYEALVISKPIMDIEGADALANTIEKNIIAELGGEIVRVDKIGRKRLAYEINKFRDGLMMLFYFKMDPAELKEFHRLVHLQEDILRLLVTRTTLENAQTPPQDNPRRRPEMRAAHESYNRNAS